MSPPVLRHTAELDTPALLEALFERSRDGFFFMMLDKPIVWGPQVDKNAVLEHVFTNQRLTLVNPAMGEQFHSTPEQLIGKTPAELFQHDPEAGRRGWRALFDNGHSHSLTNERRLDGSLMWVEGDYVCLYDAAGRITGHFGIQRDVTERVLAAEELEQSRAELRALAARIQQTREMERTRIAREIHDELGQALTALKLDLVWLENQPPRTTSGQFAIGERSITARIDETMDVVRRIATELRPSVLDQLGLEAAVEWLVQESAKRSGIEVHLEAEEFPRLPDDVASHAFRIIQEALTNVMRHAKATEVNVSVRRANGQLVIVVEDNGVGIELQSLDRVRSLGLLGMRERAVACGGTLSVTCEPCCGTVIAVNIPVPDA